MRPGGGEPETALEGFAAKGDALERRLRELGRAISVSASRTEPFYWGAGGRA